MIAKLLQLMLHYFLEPLLVELLFRQRDQTVGSLFPDREHRISEHAHDHVLQLGYENLLLDMLHQGADKLDHCQPYTPNFVRSQRGQSGNQLIMDRVGTYLFDNGTQIRNQGDDHLSGVILQKNGDHGNQMRDCILLV